jgi:hypothetical protein
MEGELRKWHSENQKFALARDSRQVIDHRDLQGPKLSESPKERASSMSAKSPKSRRTKMSRKDKEFEMLLRRAARISASAGTARRKRVSSKTA